MAPKAWNESARFFRDMGYLRVFDVLSSDQATQLCDFVLNEKRKEDTATKWLGRRPTTKLYGLYDRNPDEIMQLISNPKLVDALQALLGPNIVFVKNRHNHATVNDAYGTKKESRLHRDILQPTRGLITAAFYLEEATLANGCTNIVPGSHNFPYVGTPQPDGGGTWMDEHEEYLGLMEQALPVPMPVGSVLLFNGLVFHGVGQNNTGGTRISMTFGFRAADELDFAPDEGREVLVAGKYIYRGNDIAM